MKKYLLIIFIAFLVFNSCEDEEPVNTPVIEKGTIEGKVVATKENAVVEGLLVSTVPATFNVFTDEAGNFKFADIDADNYTVNVYKQQNIIGSKQIKLDPDEVETVIIDIDLDIPEIDKGLQVYFTFDNNLTDDIKPSREVESGVLDFTEDHLGNENSALELTGENSFVSFDVSDIDFSGDFSVTFRVKAEGPDYENAIKHIFGNSRASFYVQESMFKFTYAKSAGAGFNDITHIYDKKADRDWTYCTLVKTGDMLTLFTEGIYRGNIDITDWIKDFKNITLGYSHSVLLEQQLYFEGVIDEFRIYDRSLLFEEIQILKEK